jgi:hypothetical protein
MDLDPYYPSNNLLDDNRLVLLTSGNLPDVIHDWEKGANGGVDMWIFAELVVIARCSEYLRDIHSPIFHAESREWLGKYFLTPVPKFIPRRFDWEEYLNEGGKKWFAELRLNDSWPAEIQV